MSAVKEAEPGFYRVPTSWPDEGKAVLKPISTVDLKMQKIELQMAAREGVRKMRKELREALASGDLFHAEQEE